MNGGFKFRIPRTSWCGPGWSDNKWQPNSCGFATSRSRYDQACKEHDCDIARGVPYSKADWKFAKAVFPNPTGLAPLVYHGLGKRKNSSSEKEMPPVKKLNNYQDYSTPPNSMSRTRSMSMSSNGSKMSVASKGFTSGFAATSGYAGRLNRSGKVSSKSNYITNQYSGYDGQSGTAPNTSNAYLLAHSFPIWNVLSQVLAAIVLKSLRNVGQDCTKTTDTHDFLAPGAGNLYRLSFYNDTLQTLDIPIIQTNQILYTGFLLVDRIRGISFGSVDKPPRFWLQQLDLIKADGTKLVSINLKNTYIHTMTSLNIRIQNQTTSEAGGGETTDIDANPLEGRIYDINSSYITGRGKSNLLAVAFPARLPNTAFVSTLGGISDYGFPKTQEFLDCKKVSSIGFPPGSIKNTYIKGNFEGFLNNLVQKAIPDETESVLGAYKPPIHKFGYGVIIAVRKLMRDTTAGISLAWDTQYTISTKVTKKYPAFGVAQPTFGGNPDA